MSNVVQFRRSTAILTLVAASIGGGLIAAIAVANHSAHAPVSVVAQADTNTSTQRVNQLSNSFADVIEKASPAVVKISMTRIIKASDQQQNNPFMSDPFFRQFFGGQQGRPRPQREEGLGSGIVISPSGYILTNNHVVEKANSLKVDLSDGRTFTGKVVGTDPQTDLAVVKIAANDLPTLPFANSDAARVGDLCFAIGNPFGQDHTVTMGIVSAKNRHLAGGELSIQNFIQTDAAINPGNSGGALINARGELIGVNTMILTGGNSSFGGEGGNIGIGFAVPSNMAKGVMDQIMKNGKVSRGYLGISLQNLTADNAPLFGVKGDKGAVVADVTPGGPGAKAGLQSGDVITSINGKQVQGMEDLTMDVVSESPGSTITLDVLRNGKPMKVTATLATRPGGLELGKNNENNNGGANNEENGNGANASVRGMTVETLTPDLIQQLSQQETIPAGTKGVLIDDVDESSPAGGVAGLGRGTVIVAVNRHPIANVSDFKREMAAANGKAVLLTTLQNGQTFFLALPAQ